MRLQFDNMVTDGQEEPKKAQGGRSQTLMKFSFSRSAAKGAAKRTKTAWGTATPASRVCFVLADGMGGHPEGEVAAQLALQTISAMFQKRPSPLVKDVPEFLSSSLMAAHHQIMRYATEGHAGHPPHHLVAAIVQGGAPTGCTAVTRACMWCATANC
jgi:hypothetical protein